MSELQKYRNVSWMHGEHGDQVGSTAEWYRASEVDAALVAAREETDDMRELWEASRKAFHERGTTINVLFDELKLVKQERDAAEASLSALRQQIRDVLAKIEGCDGSDIGYIAGIVYDLLAAPASPQEKP